MWEGPVLHASSLIAYLGYCDKGQTLVVDKEETKDLCLPLNTEGLEARWTLSHGKATGRQDRGFLLLSSLSIGQAGLSFVSLHDLV
jgi:hypothetical protein